MSRVHFPGLNTLRFYAAMCVVIGHLGDQLEEQTLYSRLLSAVSLGPQSAVDFFFVLSGFLITFLLLQERRATGKINVRSFYIRRALRIWPLYYLIVWLGFFVFPWIFGASYPLANITVPQILLTILFLPNLATLSAPLAHLWSIGIEEQFYLAWPWVSRETPVLLRVIFGILILKIALSIVAFVLPGLQILRLLTDLRFECLAIGGYAAWLYDQKHLFLFLVYHPLVQSVAILLILCMIILHPTPNLPVEIASSLVFAIIILNVATNDKSLLRFSHPFSESLGKISYGIYMYHFPLIFLVVFGLESLRMSANPWMPAILYVASIPGTLLMAALSYRWFERPFLNAQKRFNVLPEVSRARFD